jgi:methylglutaconyl-CoA hydratase
VERKMGVSAFSQLATDAGMWRTADWARRNGLFAEIYPAIDEMDESVHRLAGVLSHSSPQAMREMKRIFWKGTEHWDKLLVERAAISGRLVLSDFTKNAIAKFKTR